MTRGHQPRTTVRPLEKTEKCRRENCGKKKVCADCRDEYGAQFTASNYDLTDLSAEERMLVFIYAAGGDPSEWLCEWHTPTKFDIKDVTRHGDIIDEREWKGFLFNFSL